MFSSFGTNIIARDASGGRLVVHALPSGQPPLGNRIENIGVKPVPGSFGSSRKSRVVAWNWVRLVFLLLGPPQPRRLGVSGLAIAMGSFRKNLFLSPDGVDVGFVLFCPVVRSGAFGGCRAGRNITDKKQFISDLFISVAQQALLLNRIHLPFRAYTRGRLHSEIAWELSVLLCSYSG